MRPAAALTVLALFLLAGCGGMTRYTPQLRAQGELTLRYDDGFSMHAEGQEIVIDARVPALIVAAALYALRVPFIVVVAVAALVAAGIRALG